MHGLLYLMTERRPSLCWRWMHLGVHAALTEKILDRASEYAGIRKENILVCATHLHTGGPVEPDTLIKEDAPYLDMLSRLAADAITLAQRRMEPVTAKFIMGHVDSAYRL